MKSILRLETLRGILEGKLPEKLKEARLKNFQSYKIGQAYVLMQDSCNLITLHWLKDLVKEIYSVGIIFQMATGDTNVYLYESVLVPAVAELLQPEYIEMIMLESIESVVSPPKEKDSARINLELEFTKPIDTTNVWED